MSFVVRIRRGTRSLRWVLAFAFVIPLLAGAARGAPAAPGAVAPGAVAPRWQPCSYAPGYQCAEIPVPLDYTRPGGQKIEIAVIRHPATDPARRIGSLVVNPGGPGGPGTVVLPLLYGLLPAEVRERYDIVSFDPRGVGRSDGLQCFASQSAENKALGPWADGFPVGSAQIASYDRTYQSFDAQCARRGGPVLSHMSTTDVARDMDLL